MTSSRPIPSAGPGPVFIQGNGWIFAHGEGWTYRSDLLDRIEPKPNPIEPVMTPADRTRIEASRLRHGWPTYADAWRTGKREGWLCRRIALLSPLWFPGLVLAVTFLVAYNPATAQGNDTVAIFMLVAGVVTVPFSFWRVYHRRLRQVDSHKSFAFAAGSYAPAGGRRPGNHQRLGAEAPVVAGRVRPGAQGAILPPGSGAVEAAESRLYHSPIA